LKNAGEQTGRVETEPQKTGCKAFRIAQPPEQMSRGKPGIINAKGKKMTASVLRILVTEAVSLDREINEKTDRLKELKAALAAEAQTRKPEMTPTEGGGTRWAAEGSDGCIARVNFPAPTLKARIDGEGKAVAKVKQLAKSAFSRLFVPTISYKPVEGFRTEAAALLPKAEANKLIKLCETASAPRVSFETTERAVVVA
jgi:hypothetical protein